MRTQPGSEIYNNSFVVQNTNEKDSDHGTASSMTAL